MATMRASPASCEEAKWSQSGPIASQQRIGAAIQSGAMRLVDDRRHSTVVEGGGEGASHHWGSSGKRNVSKHHHAANAQAAAAAVAVAGATSIVSARAVNETGGTPYGGGYAVARGRHHPGYRHTPRYMQDVAKPVPLSSRPVHRFQFPSKAGAATART